MRLFRKLLIAVVGFELYLRLVSRSYLWLTRAGLLKNKYPELFFLSELVKPGFTCLDIGANLGYYSTFLSELVGPEGRVLAVEPIPLFQKIWHRNVQLSSHDNTTLLPYALGATEGTIQMGTPTRNGLLHHGMTKVVQPGSDSFAQFYTVEMRTPDSLFLDLPRIDFIKCDVEGYEYQVFANMVQTLQKHKPAIQTELNGAENKLKVSQLLLGLGYASYILEEGKLKPIAAVESTTNHNTDFYFLPR